MSHGTSASMEPSSSLVCLLDFEKHAKKVLPRMAWNYYSSGADDELSLRDNVEAFDRYQIIPRVLRDVSRRNLSTKILGHDISFPVCIAPTAMQRMAHWEGEVAAAKERAGFKALVLTVDTPFFGKRRNDNRTKFILPPHLKMANFEKVDFKSRGVNQAVKESGLNEYANSLFDSSLTWNDVTWLKSITSLPIILKGILTAKDALEAVNIGVSGILVSNHGARQLDTVPATIDALRDIVLAVDKRCEVFLDGGVRRGTDVFKAIALGAKAVFIGRPIIYGLSYNGSDGVKRVLQILIDEFSSAMAFAGCSKVEEITEEYVRKHPHTQQAKI